MRLAVLLCVALTGCGLFNGGPPVAVQEDAGLTVQTDAGTDASVARDLSPSADLAGDMLTTWISDALGMCVLGAGSCVEHPCCGDWRCVAGDGGSVCTPPRDM